ncbi:MAG: AAA family ATPase [Rhodospirillales bacterium]
MVTALVASPILAPMYTVCVANTKGGSGKTTIATNLAAWYALQGLKTVIGDLDRQLSSLTWVKARKDAIPAVSGVNLGKEDAKIPKSCQRLVIDTQAAMRRKVVQDAMKRADAVIIPVLPSLFDTEGTRRFLEDLDRVKPIRKGKRPVAFVANRIKLGTRAADSLLGFLEDFPYPVVTRFRDTQLYANAAEMGASLFELPQSRTRTYLDEWRLLTDWLEEGLD